MIGWRIKLKSSLTLYTLDNCLSTMIYNSFNFILLFPIIFFAYYAIPAKCHRMRNMFLLIVSYSLYVSWKPAYALILFGVTGVTYLFALLSETAKRRKVALTVGVVLACGPLLFFKYFNFVCSAIVSAFSSVGLSIQLQGLNWAVPVGISFFTFQALGYLWDVYYGKAKAEHDFLTYALFVSFFPSILSGPINKASLMIPQLKNLRPYFDYGKALGGAKLMLWGMFMKVVVADRLGLYVDTVLPNYMNYTGMTCLVASLFYTIQIYADFAGYSLMALGVGKLLGIELMENFHRPYFAYSVTDFWRRWHISLSTWLKDYVYIPLGGSRCSKLKNYRNVLVTFLISGIWHGANWTFVVWGCIHGLLQVIEKMLGQQKCDYGLVGRTIKIGVTFLLVSFAWIFFRMPTLSDAFSVIARIFDFSLPPTVFVDNTGKTGIALYGVSIAMLLAKDFTDEFFPNRLCLFDNRRIVVRWAAYLGVISLIILAGVFGADQFIYVSF